jgi:hypothetical protein
MQGRCTQKRNIKIDAVRAWGLDPGKEGKILLRRYMPLKDIAIYSSISISRNILRLDSQEELNFPGRSYIANNFLHIVFEN